MLPINISRTSSIMAKKIRVVDILWILAFYFNNMTLWEVAITWAISFVYNVLIDNTLFSDLEIFLSDFSRMWQAVPWCYRLPFLPPQLYERVWCGFLTQFLLLTSFLLAVYYTHKTANQDSGLADRQWSTNHILSVHLHIYNLNVIFSAAFNSSNLILPLWKQRVYDTFHKHCVLRGDLSTDIDMKVLFMLMCLKIVLLPFIIYHNVPLQVSQCDSKGNTCTAYIYTNQFNRITIY